MSRIRSVHPGFFRDDRLVPCSAFARLLFIGLGVEADDKGIFEWKPVTIKMSVFPGDNIDIAELLAELVEADAVRQFDVAGKRYGAIRNFRKYQKPKTPNDVHPMADGIAEYVSLPQKEENTKVEPAPFPLKVENRFQMEDGGGKREEEKKAPPTPQGGEAGGLYSDLKGIYPQTDNTSDAKAERLFNKMKPADQLTAISQASVVATDVARERRKRNRSAVEHAQYVKGLDSWLLEGLWRPQPSTPAQHVPMTKLDRERDAELWAACERILGKPAPTSGMTWSFLNSIIEQAQARAAA